MKGYPGWFLPSLLICALGLFVSGVLLAPTTLEVRIGWELGWHLASGLRMNVATIHTMLGFLATTFVGALGGIHVRRGWQQRRNHLSGIAVLALLGTLALTGVAIFYVSDVDWSVQASAWHVIIGLAAAPLFVLHRARGRATVRRLERLETAAYRVQPSPDVS